MLKIKRAVVCVFLVFAWCVLIRTAVDMLSPQKTEAANQCSLTCGNPGDASLTAEDTSVARRVMRIKGDPTTGSLFTTASSTLLLTDFSTSATGTVKGFLTSFSGESPTMNAMFVTEAWVSATGTARNATSAVIVAGEGLIVDAWAVSSGTAVLVSFHDTSTVAGATAGNKKLDIYTSATASDTIHLALSRPVHFQTGITMVITPPLANPLNMVQTITIPF